MGTCMSHDYQFSGLISTLVLSVRASALHGRGVFAERDFFAGDVIEVCPVIRVPSTQRALLDQTDLHDYYYEWDGDAGVALGFGSLYNHSMRPNAEYLPDTERDLLVVTALSSVRKGEEVRISYTGKVRDPALLWFEPTDEVNGERR